MEVLEKKVPVPSELKTYSGWEEEINNYPYDMLGALAKCSDEKIKQGKGFREMGKVIL